MRLFSKKEKTPSEKLFDTTLLVAENLVDLNVWEAHLKNKNLKHARKAILMEGILFTGELVIQKALHKSKEEGLELLRNDLYNHIKIHIQKKRLNQELEIDLDAFLKLRRELILLDVKRFFLQRREGYIPKISLYNIFEQPFNTKPKDNENLELHRFFKSRIRNVLDTIDNHLIFLEG